MANVDAEDIRAEVRSWLESHRQGSRTRPEWMREVLASGWACTSWPEKWYGRGLPLEISWLVVEEFARVGEIGAGQDLVNIPACTFFTFGSEDLKVRWLHKLLTGEVLNSLLYSEPAAGSDLASLQTKAELRDEWWVVNGQKVWTSSALQADFGLLAARTNWDVPKHQGITLLWCPLKQDGIEIRPIRQITGESEFNEVFLSNAKVPRYDVIGDVDSGWAVLRGALAVERVMIATTNAVNVASASGSQRRVDSGGRGKLASPETLFALAKQCGNSTDTLIRDDLVKFYSLFRVHQWNVMRAQTEGKQGSRSPVASLSKLAMSRLEHTAAKIEFMIAESEALLKGAESPIGESALMHSLTAFMTSIAGGTDQIQRSVIGETVLGLQREPEMDRNKSFRDILKPSAFRSNS